MMMYFDTMVKMTNILFQGWNTYSTGDAVLASFLVFILTIAYEALKTVRDYLVASRKQHPLGYSPLESESQCRPDSETSTTDLLASLNIPATLEQILRRKKALFVVESVLHMFMFFYGYILMLLVMTYSVWFLLAIIFGSGLGYFVFQPVGYYIQLRLLYKQAQRAGTSRQGAHGPIGATGEDSAVNSAEGGTSSSPTML